MSVTSFLNSLTLILFITLAHVCEKGTKLIETTPTYTGGIVSNEIKAAMKKMGPFKNYRILGDKTLQVEVDGKWLNLKYERR